MTDASASDLAGGTNGDVFVRASASQAGRTFIESALRQQGDRYVFGHEVSNADADPDTFDCSELVQWAAAQAGVELTDGSWLQYRHVRQGGGAMTVEQALNTPGALLFRFGSDPDAGGRPSGAHVAISLGDGRTIEARGSKYGVGIFDATNRTWTHAGVVPELAGATLGTPLVVEEIDPYGDTDGDGILDRYETLVGTDPFKADTDGDGFIDSVEVVDYGTSPLDPMDNARDNVRKEMGLEALGKVVQDPVPLAPIEPIEYDMPVSNEVEPEQSNERDQETPDKDQIDEAEENQSGEGGAGDDLGEIGSADHTVDEDSNGASTGDQDPDQNEQVSGDMRTGGGSERDDERTEQNNTKQDEEDDSFLGTNDGSREDNDLDDTISAGEINSTEPIDPIDSPGDSA